MPDFDNRPGTADAPTERLETNDARQAVAPHRLRYMLVLGTAGVIIAFAVIYVAFVGF